MPSTEQVGAMSIRLRFSLAVTALALAACSGYGTGTPNPTVTTAPTPVPTGTTTTVTVRYQGNLQYNQPVELHSNTGTATAPVVGPLITTVNTDPNTLPTGGQAVFTGLSPTTSYCWKAVVPANPPPGATATLQICTSNWQNGFTLGS